MNDLPKNVVPPDINPQWIIWDAYRCRWLAEAEYKDLAPELYALLAKVTARYTFSASSSVRVETAQSLSASIQYCIGFALKYNESGYAAIRQQPLTALFAQGKTLIKTRVQSAKRTLQAIRICGFTTDNQAYNDTVQKGVPAFFAAYDIDFAVHETPGTIDYPISVDSPGLSGIDYIAGYLDALLTETLFCARFPNSDIAALMHGYHKDSDILLTNIFSHVLTNALGMVLLNAAPDLNLSPADLRLLHHRLSGLPKEARNAALKNAGETLCSRLQLLDAQMKAYIQAAIPEVSTRIAYALETNSLETVFITPKPAAPPRSRFQDGPRMEDKLFRRLTEEIRDCRFTSDKLALIQRTLHSISDLTDLLTADCLAGEEFNTLFASLDDLTLAMLAGQIPQDGENMHLTKDEQIWHAYFRDYIESLPPARRAHISALAATVDLE